MAVIKPLVYAPIVTEKFKGKIVVANLATDLGVLSGTVGDTVSFPMFSKIGDCADVVRGTAIEVEELSQTESKATIKQVGKGVRIYDMDDLTALGNFVENGANQQATVFARKVDSDLIAECDKATLKIATVGATTVTATELNAGLAMFGDEQDTSEMGAIVINSLLSASFYAMPEFTDAQKTYNGVNGNGVVENGCIGHFRGIPVLMSDKDTLDTVKSEVKTYIIKKGALGKMFKRGINIEDERKASLKATDLYGDLIYAVKLLNAEGVVVLRKTIV